MNRQHRITTLAALLLATLGLCAPASADLIADFDGVGTGGWTLDNTGLLTPTANAAGTGARGIEFFDQNDGVTHFVAPWTGDLSAEIGATLRFGLVFVVPAGGATWVPLAEDIRIQGNGTELTLNLTVDDGGAPALGTVFDFDIALTGATFGVSDAVFANVMSAVDFVKIRSEYWLGNGIESYLVQGQAAAPEPGMLGLLGLGLAGLAMRSRRRMKTNTRFANPA